MAQKAAGGNPGGLKAKGDDNRTSSRGGGGKGGGGRGGGNKSGTGS